MYRPINFKFPITISFSPTTNLNKLLFYVQKYASNLRPQTNTIFTLDG